VAPGTVIKRRVQVSNGTDTTSRISMYPAAAEIRGGTFTGAAGRTKNELSRWISLKPRSPVLGPQKRTFVNVSITVPSQASRGERYGVVWAEMTSTPEDGGVTQVSRVGIRIYLSVGPGGAPPSDFTITSLTAARNGQATPLLHASVRNTGKRALDLNAELDLSEGPGGISAGPFTSDSASTLGIGERGRVTVKLDKALPRGPWLARIAVTSGLDKRSAQATVTFPKRTGTADPVPVERGIPWWVWPIAVGLLVLLLFVILLKRWRERAEREDALTVGPEDPALVLSP